MAARGAAAAGLARIDALLADIMSPRRRSLPPLPARAPAPSAAAAGPPRIFLLVTAGAPMVPALSLSAR